MSITTREFFEAYTLKREHVDKFLDPNAHNYAVFDSELGYIRQELRAQGRHRRKLYHLSLRYIRRAADVKLCGSTLPNKHIRKQFHAVRSGQ